MPRATTSSSARAIPGWDPETSVNLDPRFYGEDNDGVPQPRIFKLGVNITF